MKGLHLVCALAVVLGMAGCSSPGKKMNKMRLGLTEQEVLDSIGEPSLRRASKVYDDGNAVAVWEYQPRFSLDPKTYWLYFEKGKLVQWGQPGDFTGGGGKDAPVKEYNPTKTVR